MGDNEDCRLEITVDLFKNTNDILSISSVEADDIDALDENLAESTWSTPAKALSKVDFPELLSPTIAARPSLFRNKLIWLWVVQTSCAPG